MALKGIDIFKVSPKKNCKECGCPTCMAFSMKVAQGGLSLDDCPYFSGEAKQSLLEASAPPMRTISVGTGEHAYSLGGETVLFRHEKSYVSPTRYAVSIKGDVTDDSLSAQLQAICGIDFERIQERMQVEMILLSYDAAAGKERYIELVQRAAAAGRVLILDCEDPDTASAALDLIKEQKPILCGANPSNYEEMSRIAASCDVTLCVRAPDIDSLYDTLAAIEDLGNHNLMFDVGSSSIREAYAIAVQFRRAAIRDQVRTCGYPSLVRADLLSEGDPYLQAALLSLFTVKYGSVVVTDAMTYAEANPIYGLRQNLYSDPQKPMKVEPGIYPMNGADENSICVTTVDFALTYFLVSGELERSGVPLNLIITDAGGYSVLTSWAAGKFSADTISAFIKEQGIEEKIKSRQLVIPGKVAVLKSELEEKLPGWEIIVAPNEAAQLVRFMKELTV